MSRVKDHYYESSSRASPPRLATPYNRLRLDGSCVKLAIPSIKNWLTLDSSTIISAHTSKQSTRQSPTVHGGVGDVSYALGCSDTNLNQGLRPVRLRFPVDLSVVNEPPV
ncbi:hypothetical protein CBL_04233 [Carabus blaptoides fortunei]